MAQSSQKESARVALGKRALIYARAGTYINKIYNRLLIDLAFNSSRLEGNTYTLPVGQPVALREVVREIAKGTPESTPTRSLPGS